MAEQTRSGVVVRVDGSRITTAAVCWAARAAAATDQTLTLCLVLPSEHLAHLPDAPAISLALRRRAETILGRARARAASVAPGVRTVSHIATGQAGAEMLRLARTADLVVVGSLGPGWSDPLVIGASAAQVARHAPCTVVVTRLTSHRADGPVLIGVDDSDGAQAALRFGVESAAWQGRDVIALHAYTVPAVAHASGLARPTRHAAADVLDTALTPWVDKYPDVTVRREIRRGQASRILAEASVDASLVVAGSRGRGGFTRLLLGSVGHYLLALSSAPVAIAR